MKGLLLETVCLNCQAYYDPVYTRKPKSKNPSGRDVPDFLKDIFK
jgi:hypothetical protein